MVPFFVLICTIYKNKKIKPLIVKNVCNFLRAWCIIGSRETRYTVDGLLLMRGGDAMVTYEAVSAFATTGLLIVAIITLLKSKH